MNKLLIVAKREYFKNIKKASFWIATLLFPIFFAVIGVVSTYSSTAVQNSIEQASESAKNVLIYDGADVINTKILETDPYKNIKLVDDASASIEKVKKGEAEVFFEIPQDFYTSKKINIYQQDKGIFAQGAFADFANTLIKQSLLQNIPDEAKVQLFNASYTPNITSYKNGEVVDNSFTKLIIPGIAVIIYFILVNFANSYLLSSVAEEKENRMIEIVLTAVDSTKLIVGKILGQIATVLTQLVVLIIMASIGLFGLNSTFTNLLSGVQLNPLMILMGIFYILCGFLIMGNIMVGVGAAMPNYRDAQGFSSIFIILSIFPVYFATIILAEPSGTVSQIVSYFPLTSAMILLFRFMLGELSNLEIVISSLLLIIYVAATFWLAIKLFEFGSLEYSNKISFKGFLKSFNKNK